MSRVECERLLQYRQSDVFDLVADVERYPEFLPGWRSARILERSGDRLLVEQELGLGALSWRFRTRAHFERPERITVETDEAPFDHMHQLWRFEATSPGTTRVSLRIDYGLRGALLAAIVSRMFDAGFRQTLAAFERRARQVIG